jgi:hypothetical protein
LRAWRCWAGCPWPSSRRGPSRASSARWRSRCVSCGGWGWLGAVSIFLVLASCVVAAVSLPVCNGGFEPHHQAARELEEVGERIAREAEAARQQALADAKKAAEKAAIEDRIQRAKEEEERLRKNAEMQRQLEAERKAKAEAEAKAAAEEKTRKEKEAAEAKKKQEEEAARIKAQVRGMLSVIWVVGVAMGLACGASRRVLGEGADRFVWNLEPAAEGGGGEGAQGA